MSGSQEETQLYVWAPEVVGWGNEMDNETDLPAEAAGTPSEGL